MHCCSQRLSVPDCIRRSGWVIDRADSAVRQTSYDSDVPWRDRTITSSQRLCQLVDALQRNVFRAVLKQLTDLVARQLVPGYSKWTDAEVGDNWTDQSPRLSACNWYDPAACWTTRAIFKLLKKRGYSSLGCTVHLYPVHILPTTLHTTGRQIGDVRRTTSTTCMKTLSSYW